MISVLRITLLMPVLANPGFDSTYNTTPAYHWTVAETNLAVVVASAMTLKPFVRRLFPRLFLPLTSGAASHPYHEHRSGDDAAMGVGVGGAPLTFGGSVAHGGSGGRPTSMSRARLLLLRNPFRTATSTTMSSDVEVSKLAIDEEMVPLDESGLTVSMRESRDGMALAKERGLLHHGGLGQHQLHQTAAPPKAWLPPCPFAVAHAEEKEMEK